MVSLSLLFFGSIELPTLELAMRIALLGLQIGPLYYSLCKNDGCIYACVHVGHMLFGF